MSYKRLIEFQTKKYEDLDSERGKLLFDQSLKQLKKSSGLN
jgi:hypothetical protein